MGNPYHPSPAPSLGATTAEHVVVESLDDVRFPAAAAVGAEIFAVVPAGSSCL